MAITANPERGGSAREPDKQTEKNPAIPRSELKKVREKARSFLLSIENPSQLTLPENFPQNIIQQALLQLSTEIMPLDDHGLAPKKQLLKNEEFITGFRLLQRFVRGMEEFLDQSQASYVTTEVNISGIYLNKAGINNYKGEITGLGLVKYAELVLSDRQPKDERGENIRLGIHLATILYTQAVVEYIDPLLDQLNKDIAG